MWHLSPLEAQPSLDPPKWQNLSLVGIFKQILAPQKHTLSPQYPLQKTLLVPPLLIWEYFQRGFSIQINPPAIAYIHTNTSDLTADTAGVLLINMNVPHLAKLIYTKSKRDWKIGLSQVGAPHTHNIPHRQCLIQYLFIGTKFANIITKLKSVGVMLHIFIYIIRQKWNPYK